MLATHKSCRSQGALWAPLAQQTTSLGMQGLSHASHTTDPNSLLQCSCTALWSSCTGTENRLPRFRRSRSTWRGDVRCPGAWTAWSAVEPCGGYVLGASVETRGGVGQERWALQWPSRRAHQRKIKKPAVTSVGASGTRNSAATKLCDVI